MLKQGVFQDHTPNGVASMHFQGVIYRHYIQVPEGIDQASLMDMVLNGYREDYYYTIPISMKMVAAQAKQFNMYFVVNNATLRFNPGTSVETYSRTSGAIADQLENLGFNGNTAAIALFNEPGKKKFCGPGIEGAKKYVQFVKRSNNYVNGRFPLILVNDEYHLIDEKYIFEHTKEVSKRVWGVHHLSSLGKSPAWQNVRDAKTQANEWGVPIVCDEGGSWWAKYLSAEGHNINKHLIQECDRYDYAWCAIVCVDVNLEMKEHGYPQLGYRKWDKYYRTILTSQEDLKKYWQDFEAFIKTYRKEEQPMSPEPTRTIRLDMPRMHGVDIKLLQTKLRDIGFDLEVDSTYDSPDYWAIRRFQKLAKIVVDGVVGPQTRETLDKTTVDNFYPEVFKDIYESKDYSVEAVDYFLANNAHPNLLGHGKYFKFAETETGIPVEWQLANGMQESGVKTSGDTVLLGNSYHGRVNKNLYGWAVTDSGPVPGYKFDTYEDCIKIVARKIKALFLNPQNWRYKGDHIFGIEVKYSTAPYNAINKAKWYRFICEFLDAGIRTPVPQYMNNLIALLDQHYVKQ